VFKDVGHYSEWPKVADAVIKAERMITKFGSLFAGNVDLDHIGLEGTPVNDRWLSNEHLATVFDKCQAMAQLMDRLGYDPWWAAEHHFQREGYECIPNLLMLFVHAKSQIINRSSPSERRATAVKI